MVGVVGVVVGVGGRRLCRRGRGVARVVGVQRRPGAGVDEQAAADGAGVGDLALAHRRGAHARARLAELVDLVHDAIEVSVPVLVLTARHRQWDG